MEIDDGEALELTYDLVATTMQSHDIRYLLSRFMHKVVGILGAEAALVRTAKSGELELVDSVGFQKNSPLIDARISLGKFRQQEVPERILVGTRVDSFSADLLSNLPPQSGKSNRQQLISVPLKFKNSIYGCYQFLLPTEEPLEKNSLILLETVGKHVGFLVEQARMDSDSARLLLVEERSRMANEMHDSLAQTLASLRMQVRVMDETFQQGDEKSTWEELEKLEKRVEQANSELRSLIGHFRAPIQSHEVVEAVDGVISTFRQDTDISVYFQNEWQSDDLSAESRTDVIRIIQEALANIKKHAKADNVRVLLRNHSNKYKIMVEDDGEGFEESSVRHSRQGELSHGASGKHLGQEIMSERANNLGGVLQVESEPGEGTRVSLEFHSDMQNVSEQIPAEQK
jgi:two-component system nitrate/nitrite sensor histidine kinase NarX